MDAFVFRFTAEQLRRIPQRYLGFLIASGHCCNELVILLPYIVFEHDIKDANEVEAAFIQTRKFTIDRILISKIVEYGELFAKTFKEPTDSADEIARVIWTDFQTIAAKLKKAKWARILRNKISFHYDAAYATESLEKLDGEHPLRLIAGRVKGVTLFEFAEEITVRPSFEAAGQGDIGVGMDVVNRFIVELVNSITAFHARTAISLFKTYGLMTERTQSTLRGKYRAEPGTIRVPVAISVSKKSAKSASIRRSRGRP